MKLLEIVTMMDIKKKKKINAKNYFIALKAD